MIFTLDVSLFVYGSTCTEAAFVLYVIRRSRRDASEPPILFRTSHGAGLVECKQHLRLSVGIIPLKNFTLTPFSGFIYELRLAADECDRSRTNACAWTVLGSDRNPVRSSSGVKVYPQELFGAPEKFDFIIAAGGLLPASETPMVHDRARAYLRAAY